MGKMICPCKGCTDRWVSETSRCHMCCDKYAQWAGYIKEKNQKEAEFKKAIQAVNDLVYRNKNR